MKERSLFGPGEYLPRASLAGRRVFSGGEGGIALRPRKSKTASDDFGFCFVDATKAWQGMA